MIKIRAIKIEVNTDTGLFGAEFKFSNGFNIVRGDNTSGKSSLFQSILYCLGFEELIGGKNEKTMQSVLKDIVEYPKGTGHGVLQSFVLLEFENAHQEIITVRRGVLNSSRAPQLVDVYHGATLSDKNNSLIPQPMYVHDKGAASDDIYGYHLFLEKFLGWDLPYVYNKIGEKRKIYLQQIAPSFIIEQKSGWSDFLATMPFYGLTNKEARVIEFLLDLDVYENKQIRQNILTTKNILEENWVRLFKQLTKFAEKENGSLIGFDSSPTIINDFSKISILLARDGKKYTIPEFIENQSEQFEMLEKKMIPKISENIKENEEKLNSINEIIHSETLNYEILSDKISHDKNKLTQYKFQLESLTDDLRKNKGALKVKRLGAEIDGKMFQELYPPIEKYQDDSLLPDEIDQSPMLIEENIIFIEAQIKMIKVYIEGLEYSITKKEDELKRIQTDLSIQRKLLRAIKKELVSDERLPSEVEIEKKLNIKKQIEFHTRYLEEFNDLVEEVKILSKRYEQLLKDSEKLPVDYFSAYDRQKLGYLLYQFKRLLSEFDYKSKSNDFISISVENYLPVAQKEFGDDMKSYDLRFDSSASDFIRCIWAYTCSLFLTSEKFNGNHPNLLMLDEPKQQDISSNHFRSFLTELSGYKNVQTLLFASFENSDESYAKATQGLNFKLNFIDKKLIKPISNDK